MKLHIVSFLALLFLFSLCGMAQEAPGIKTDEESDQLQQKAVEYLRDTSSEVSTLRTNENRISFSSELANLMWFHDEKEARKMFSSVADSFVQLVSEYNARVEAYGGTRDENDLFGGGFSFTPDQRVEAIRKLYKARDVRSQIALAIAEHDAQFGYDFVIRTSTIVTDVNLAASFTEQNETLEKQIIERMGVRNVERSLEFGRRSLKRGFSTELVTLAAKVYQRDPEAAIEFGKELVDKVRSETGADTNSFEHIFSILQTASMGLENAKSGQEPLFDKPAMSGLAELLATNLLRLDEYDSYMLDQYVAEIEKYSPALAKRVETKFAEKDEENGLSGRSPGIGSMMAGEAKPDETPTPTAEQIAEERRNEEREAMMKELQDFGSDELSGEQKAKFINRARTIVSGMTDPMMKIVALTQLAVKVKQLGDAKLASEIMREADVMVKPNPRNFVDYFLLWSLASGYAEVEPDRAFSAIEEAIFRLNDTIGAFVKVAEFIDVTGEIVIDGEVQLGSFGGSMTRNAVGMVANSNTVLKSLSIADFERTKALADKFEKPEIRILARLLVLRSALETNETKDIGLIK